MANIHDERIEYEGLLDQYSTKISQISDILDTKVRERADGLEGIRDIVSRKMIGVGTILDANKIDVNSYMQGDKLEIEDSILINSGNFKGRLIPSKKFIAVETSSNVFDVYSRNESTGKCTKDDSLKSLLKPLFDVLNSSDSNKRISTNAKGDIVAGITNKIVIVDRNLNVVTKSISGIPENLMIDNDGRVFYVHRYSYYEDKVYLDTNGTQIWSIHTSSGSGTIRFYDVGDIFICTNILGSGAYFNWYVYVISKNNGNVLFNVSNPGKEGSIYFASISNVTSTQNGGIMFTVTLQSDSRIDYVTDNTGKIISTSQVYGQKDFDFIRINGILAKLITEGNVQRRILEMYDEGRIFKYRYSMPLIPREDDDIFFVVNDFIIRNQCKSFDGIGNSDINQIALLSSRKVKDYIIKEI